MTYKGPRQSHLNRGARVQGHLNEGACRLCDWEEDARLPSDDPAEGEPIVQGRVPKTEYQGLQQW